MIPDQTQDTDRTTNSTADGSTDGTDRQRALLAAYDTQLREAAEVQSAKSWDRDGPIIRAVFPDGHGFVSYRNLVGYDGDDDGRRLDELITRTIDYFEHATDLPQFEWKTRGHDRPADLGDHLVAAGLVAGDPESVMVGDVGPLAVDVPLPATVRIRRIGAGGDGGARHDVERALDMQMRVFGDSSPRSVDHLVQLVTEPDSRVEFWIAESVSDVPEVVCAGRLDVVAGTDFAGIWGGSTLPQWRGQGIYRALTAHRARSAIDRGVRYLHSDSTEFSRPILERSGMVKVTTTTPYEWKRRS